MKVRIHSVETHEEEVEIPDKCPKCGADFRDEEANNLRMEELGTSFFSGCLMGRGKTGLCKSFEKDEAGKAEDHVDGYWYGCLRYECRACDHVLAQRGELVECKVCHKRVPLKTAHRHDGGYIGDECCWDERLRTTE